MTRAAASAALEAGAFAASPRLLINGRVTKATAATVNAMASRMNATISAERPGPAPRGQSQRALLVGARRALQRQARAGSAPAAQTTARRCAWRSADETG